MVQLVLFIFIMWVFFEIGYSTGKNEQIKKQNALNLELKKRILDLHSQIAVIELHNLLNK